MGPPDERGRAAIFRHYLAPLKIDPAIDSACLAGVLAALTPGFTGADIAHVCNRAAMLCVKEASMMEPPPEDLAISNGHFRLAIREMLRADPAGRKPSTSPKAKPVAGIYST